MRSIVTARPIAEQARAWLAQFVANDARIGDQIGRQTLVTNPGRRFETELVSQIKRERLSYFLASSADFKNLSDSLQAKVQSMALQEAAAALVVSRDLLRISALLDANGIPHLIYKGLVLSLLTQQNLTARGGGDIDILVSENDVLRAHRLLIENGAHSGFRMVPGESRSFRFYRWLYKELPLPMPLSEVDLHWRIVNPVGISPSTEILLSRSQTVQIMNREIKTLADCDAKVLAAYSFFFDGAKSLRQLLDFQILAQCNNPLECEYSPELVSLVAAVTAHAEGVFELETSVHELDARAKRFLKLISRNWSAGASSKSMKHRKRISLRQHLESLRIETSLGGPLQNLARALAAKVFDFKGTNFARDRLVFTKALWREIVGQIRFMRRWGK